MLVAYGTLNGHAPSSFTIVKIERIVNQTLWKYSVSAFNIINKR